MPTNANSRRKKPKKDFDRGSALIDDETSPYLSEERAQRLGKRRSKWVRDVRYVQEHIRELCCGRENIRLAAHREPFLWRLFVFDEEMFVSGYLHPTRNDEHAPVFKLRAGNNSLYAPFRAYYDHLWRLYAGDLRQTVVALQDGPPNPALKPTPAETAGAAERPSR